MFFEEKARTARQGLHKISQPYNGFILPNTAKGKRKASIGKKMEKAQSKSKDKKDKKKM